jgi:ribosome-associated toxin RatA of RatAB toxin-antitoxin module
MAKIEINEILAVDRDRVFRTVIKYENYPKFIYGINSVQVTRMSTSTAQVTYHLSILKDIVYTLDLVEDKQLGTVKWHLVKSDFFRVNHGFWEIRDLGPGRSSIRYCLEFELKLPIPQLVIKHLLKRKLSSIIKAFEKQARESCP